MSEVSRLWHETIFLIPNWKWIFFAAATALGFGLRPFFEIGFSALKKTRKFQTLHPLLKYFCELPIERPLAWLLVTLFWHGALEGLELPAKFEKYLGLGNQIIQTFFLIRLSYLGAESLGRWLNKLVQKTENKIDDQLVPLAIKTLKVFVVIFGILILLQNLGFNVMSLLAGLGLGGLALALAAQDTAANVFGSITIILDKPFQIGDWVKIGETEGTVEDIGFRSTRIRTFYQSLVSIPNSVVAKERIDNMGARPARRVRHVLGIACETPNSLLKQFMDEIRLFLFQIPQVDKERVLVTFNQMGDFNLQVLMQFFLQVEDSQDEVEIQEEVLLAVKYIAERLQVGFAYPTQTVHLKTTSAFSSDSQSPL